MAWLLAAVWSAAILWGTRMARRAVWLRRAMACGLAASMAVQLLLLRMDGLLSLETALPLHLCGLFGVLSVPMLLFGAPAPLYELSAFLAGPAAAVTLLFPAVIVCSHPMLMRLAFLNLHVLVAATPLCLWRMGKPLPTDPRRALILSSGYLVAVAAFNRAFDTNYLFLSAQPAHTPLALLGARGGACYVCALCMACMLVFTGLSRLYAVIEESS